MVLDKIVHFGDIVACEPVVRSIRKKYPESFIVFALHKNYRELMETHPEVNHVLPLTCVTEWARFAGLNLFDEIIDLNIDGRTCEICRVPWHKPSGSRGVTAENYYNTNNLIDAYCMSAGLPAPNDSPRIYPSKNDISVVNDLDLPERFVAFHADSNEKERALPIMIWEQIVFHINNVWRLPVIEIGLKPLVLHLNEDMNRSLCGQLSILQSAEVIRRCILYLGTDSGPAHLANACGTYGIIALGHYRNFQRYLPYSGGYANGSHCELLYHNGPIAEIPLAQIVEAIDRRLQSI